jgi:thiol-disulfide isomerase/thioredoxin
VVIGVLLSVGVVGAAQAPPVYPVGDARADIAAAAAAAKRDGKHVILDFGADWCPDCRVLDAVLKDPAVKPFVDANFHIVRIDVGRRDRNGDLVEQYRATSGEWIPALVALDSTGAIIGGTSTDVRVTRRTTPAELVGLLQRWAPKRQVAELAVFSQNGVRVHVALERDSLGDAWIAASFRPVAPDVHLYGASLPANGMDGLGRPTRLTLVPSDAWRVRGSAVSDRREEVLRFDALNTALPVYPAGAVTLRVPITITASPSSRDAAIHVTYMGCSDLGCLPPVIDRRVPVRLPAAVRRAPRPREPGRVT